MAAGMSEHIIETIQDIIKGDMNGVSQGTVNRLVLTMLVELSKGIRPLATVTLRVENNPSLVWLIRNKPKTTIVTILIVFLILELIVEYAPQIIGAFVPGGLLP